MTTPSRRALILGNSDGIGLALTRRLLADGWELTGVSRSDSPLGDQTHHVTCDVSAPAYRETLAQLVATRGPFDLCVWCVGVGEELLPETFDHETRVVETNFTAAVTTFSVVVPAMLSAGRGHLIGLSSLADLARIADAPSYSASKAGLSNYLESLALALRPKGVYVTNVRFGFVDTKMAKSDVKPLMISPEHAADKLMGCLRKRPLRLSYPRTAAAAMLVGSWIQAVRFLLG